MVEFGGGIAPSASSLSVKMSARAEGCRGAVAGLRLLSWSCDNRKSLPNGDGGSLRRNSVAVVDRDDWEGGEFMETRRADVLLLSFHRLKSLYGKRGVVESIVPSAVWGDCSGVFSSPATPSGDWLDPSNSGDEVRV
jgi:hypothetical protein